MINIIIPEEMRTKCEIYSRVVGYYRPTNAWNKGKVEEFKDRKEFDEKTSINSPFATNTKPISPELTK